MTDVFTISNNLKGFNTLLDKLRACSSSQNNIKVELGIAATISLGFFLTMVWPPVS